MKRLVPFLFLALLAMVWTGCRSKDKGWGNSAMGNDIQPGFLNDYSVEQQRQIWEAEQKANQRP